jgi:hypothetical protein
MREAEQRRAHALRGRWSAVSLPWRRSAVALLGIAVLAVAARIALPFVLERYVNRVLDRNATYQGSVADVDVALWRGAYMIEGVHVEKRNGRVPVPFVAAPRVDLSIQWRALFDGAFVGEIHFDRLELNFVAGPRDADRQTGAGADWRRTVESLFPVKLNQVKVRHGVVHYRDFQSEPKVDIYLRDVELVAQNLTNSRDLSADRVAHITVRATPMTRGRLSARIDVDPFAVKPDFDLDGSLTNADLTQWNDFLRAYAGIDVKEGSITIYAELLASNGRFEGYVKPIVEGLDVLRLSEEVEEQGWLASVWEALVGGTAEVLEHQPDDRQAARIPISGTVPDPKASFWAALGTALRHAFVKELLPRLEGSVGTR